MSGSAGELKTEHWRAPKSVPPECSFVKVRNSWIVTASGGVQIESFRFASQVETRAAMDSIRPNGAPEGSHWWWN